jgi:hypothetical protein
MTALRAPPDQITTLGRAGRRAVLERHDVLKETSHLAQLIEKAVDAQSHCGAKGYRLEHGKAGVNVR